MPNIPIYIARIDIGKSSGTIYSYEPIDEIEQFNLQIRKVGKITVTTPSGYELEMPTDPSPYGDIGSHKLVFDPVETAKVSDGKRVYMRAARLIERMSQEPHLFTQVGPGESY